MHDSLKHCNVNRIKQLIEVHQFDVEGYVKIWLYALYKVHKEDKASALTMPFLFENIGSFAVTISIPREGR